MRLVLNADDLGYSPGVNHAIFDLHARGRISSASAIANLPHSGAALERAASHPELQVGVHLNLTKGRPCVPADSIPSLVDGEGSFYPAPTFFARAVAGLVEVSEVEAELRAQIAVFAEFGVKSEYVDSHSHWHSLPQLRHLLQNIATDLNILQIRQANLRRALIPNSLWLACAPRGHVTGSRLPRTDYLLSLHHWLGRVGESPALDDSHLLGLIGRPEVTVELVTHPGLADDADFPPDTLTADKRQREYEFLMSESFSEWLVNIDAELVGR